MTSYTRTVAPTSEPVALEDVKDHLRIAGTDDDTLLDGFIATATGHLERSLGLALLTQTWVARFDAWSIPFGRDQIPLRYPPLASVTSIQYVDLAGDTQTFGASNYAVDTYSSPGRVTLAYNVSWPTMRAIHNAMTITFVAGYTDASEIPPALLLAIKMHVGHMYEHRESMAVGVPGIVPQGYWDLVAPYRPVRL